MAGMVMKETMRKEKAKVFLSASKSWAAAWWDIIGKMAVATAMA